MRDDPTRLQHIRECVAKILRWTSSGETEFRSNEMMREAVVRELEIIGEATKGLSTRIRAAHPEIPWKDMAGLRDVLVHDYDVIDIEELWKVVHADIPKLRKALDRLP